MCPLGFVWGSALCSVLCAWFCVFCVWCACGAGCDFCVLYVFIVCIGTDVQCLFVCSRCVLCGVSVWFSVVSGFFVVRSVVCGVFNGWLDVLCERCILNLCSFDVYGV